MAHLLVRRRNGLGGQAYLPVLTFVLLSMGCGVSEYGKEFDKQQKRITEFDKENSVLDRPVELPFGKDPKGGTKVTFPPQIFFRIPKGISYKADERYTGPVYYFPNSKNPAGKSLGSAPTTGAAPPLVPMTQGTAPGSLGSGLQAVYLAIGKDKKRDDFLAECAQQAPFFSRIDVTKPMEKGPMLTPYGRPPFQYETVTVASPPSTYYIYLYQGTSPFIVAVAFEVETGKEGEMNEFRQKILYSLQSLALGAEVQQAKKNFKGP